LVADFGEEADLRVNVDDVGQLRELLANPFVKELGVIERLRFFACDRVWFWRAFARAPKTRDGR
jgi:hypothetical protein